MTTVTLMAIITGEWIDLPCIVNRFIPSFDSFAILVSTPITFARASASPTPFGGSLNPFWVSRRVGKDNS